MYVARLVKLQSAQFSIKLSKEGVQRGAFSSPDLSDPLNTNSPGLELRPDTIPCMTALSHVSPPDMA
jgi:hypothetical protein